ncbi:MAG: OmpA family protein [Treponemataceae bacterium]
MKEFFLRKFLPLLFICLCSSLFSQLMEATSTIDWTKPNFNSKILFNAKEANIIMPSGRSTIIDRIDLHLPTLLKDQILYTRLNSSTRVGDLIANETISLEQINMLIDGGKQTPSFFSLDNDFVQMTHSIDLKNLIAMLVAHTVPDQVKTPIEQVATRKYTGIVIDARGSLPIHGEFTQAQGEPALFPKIWDETMDLLYERNMVDPTISKTEGIVQYGYDSNIDQFQNRVGNDPLVIMARKFYGIYPTDPVISRRDALKILSNKENLDLLKQGKIVILLDKQNLVYDVKVLVKKDDYYVIYNDLSDYFYKNRDANITVSDAYKGIQLAIKEINFEPDTANIVVSEADRLNSIAISLKNALKVSDFTILVEGHTARIGDRATELPLSIFRAQAIIEEMVLRGLPRDLFEFKGYGGDVPLASNETAEGRAKNRRVEIIIQTEMSETVQQ